MTVATGKWVEVKDERALAGALALCKGQYQQNLVLGFEALSGSTLRGKAKEYGGKYEASRRHLLKRLQSAGIPVSEREGTHGKRILVIG